MNTGCGRGFFINLAMIRIWVENSFLLWLLCQLIMYGACIKFWHVVMIDWLGNVILDAYPPLPSAQGRGGYLYGLLFEKR